MRKKIFILFLVIFILSIGIKLYWYFETDANLILFISNYSVMISEEDSQPMSPPVSFDIFIDNKLIYQNDSVYGFYNLVKSNVNIGCHRLKVSVNSCIVEEIFICVLPIKWVLIEYPNIEGIFITTHSTPPKLE